jgi:ribonuclease BN (tRNA processing enzyme)
MNPQLPPSVTTKLVLLGTGTPVTNPTRMGPSSAVVVNQQPYIVDFGPGVVRRAAAAYHAGILGLAPSKLTRAFATHLHSDHTSGYPDLIFTPGVVGRKKPLEVYGPAGLCDMTEHIIAAYSEDLRERIDGLEPTTPDGYVVNSHEVKPGMVYQDENVQVIAFPVRHGSWPAFGFKFITPDRTIVISGDTAPVDSILEQANGCDILLHEVYAVKGFNKRSADWQKYHANVHTSAHELGKIAREAKPGLVVLYHQLFWGTSEEELLEEVRSVYDGQVVSGKDLDVF